jgi:phosphonate transport system permease protein
MKDGSTAAIHAENTNTEKKHQGYIRKRSSTALYMTIAVLVAITIFGFFILDYKGFDAESGTVKLARNLWRMVSTPVAKHFTFPEAALALGQTLGLAFLTTFVGALTALILAPFASQNLSKAPIVAIIKAIVALVRAVPTVIWVLIFAIGAGLGSVAAVVGMSFHSFGYLLKAYSETFEELDESVIEALRASGATWSQIVLRAVIPSSSSGLVSWTFIRFEINFMNAVAMGAAAGAGGIGFDLFMASEYYMDVGEVGMITWLILAFALCLELGATRLKRSQQIHR